MSNIKNKSNNITMKLIFMQKKSHNPCETKSCQSEFIYDNSTFYQKLDLLKDPNITGFSMGELTSHIAKYEEEYYRQSQKVIQTISRVTSLNTHSFEKNKTKQTCTRYEYSLCNDHDRCIGTTLQMYKALKFSVSY
ncbi:hypothetical protein [Photorhabdus cinerea]|nr:hypothetical protein [Photorhabdus cinerea]